MTFTVREYQSDEQFDLAKFMDFKVDCYDVINSPFLNAVRNLPTVGYYYVDDGYKEVDMISQEKYGSPYLVFLIQFYNSMFVETFPEGTRLNLFSLADLNKLYADLSNGLLT